MGLGALPPAVSVTDTTSHGPCFPYLTASPCRRVLPPCLSAVGHTPLHFFIEERTRGHVHHSIKGLPRVLVTPHVVPHMPCSCSGGQRPSQVHRHSRGCEQLEPPVQGGCDELWGQKTQQAVTSTATPMGAQAGRLPETFHIMDAKTAKSVTAGQSHGTLSAALTLRAWPEPLPTQGPCALPPTFF